VRGTRAALVLVTVGVLLASAGCQERPALILPTAADLSGLYGPTARVGLSGNVGEVRVRQDADQLRRGGSVWAKVGPYIYLFSPQTQELFEAYSGVGGVRVTTYDPGGKMVATALLERGTLNSITWRRARSLVARARLEGTRRPSYMIDLVEYGEDLVSHEYSPRYVPAR
jgi:hypothetical protein